MFCRSHSCGSVLDYRCRGSGRNRRARTLHPNRRRTTPLAALLRARRSLDGEHGAVGRHLARTVFGASAWVGLGACVRVGVDLGEVGPLGNELLLALVLAAGSKSGAGCCG